MNIVLASPSPDGGIHVMRPGEIVTLNLGDSIVPYAVGVVMEGGRTPSIEIVPEPCVPMNHMPPRPKPVVYTREFGPVVSPPPKEPSRLETVRAMIAKIMAGGQRYKVGSREVQFPDLATLLAEERRLVKRGINPSGHNEMRRQRARSYCRCRWFRDRLWMPVWRSFKDWMGWR